MKKRLLKALLSFVFLALIVGGCSRALVKLEPEIRIQFAEVWVQGGAYWETDHNDGPMVWVRIFNNGDYSVSGYPKVFCYADSGLTSLVGFAIGSLCDGIEEVASIPEDPVSFIPPRAHRDGFAVPKMDWEKYPEIWTVWGFAETSLDKLVMSKPRKVSRR